MNPQPAHRLIGPSHTLDAGGAIAGLEATRGATTLVLAEQIVHDARGQVLSLRAGQVTIAQTYDAAGRLAAGPGLDLAYADGQLAQRSTPSGTSSYTHDALDRLDSETGPAGARQHAYDPNGNRTSDGAAPPTVAAFAPNSDRLETLNGVAATHDAAGNLTGYGQMYYDDFGDLVEVRKSDQTLLATYTYDENHRRIRKVTTAAAAHGAGTTYYHYLPDGRLLAETTPGNQPQATYIWNGPTLTGFITYNPRTLHTVQVDQLGSPYQIRSLAGQVLWRWESEGYGGTAPNEDVDGDGTRLVFNPRFPGQYYDQESGLHYNGHRYYHPRLGRYISSDPIGIAGGINTYAYVGGNPLSFTDPLGLQAYTGQTPPSSIPGGPWAPQAGQPPGTFQGPKDPGGGPRNICRYVPDRLNGGPNNAPEGYWKTKTPQGEWQRFNLQGNPITAEQAHPGNRPASPPAAAPATNWLLRIGVGIGLMIYSGELQ